MPVSIIGMVTENKEVRKLEWLEELSCFDIPIGELMLELASTIGYKDLSPMSFIVE